MKKKITQIIISVMLLVIIVLLNVQNLQAQEQKIYRFNNSSGKDSYSVVRQDAKGVNINFSINQFSTISKEINGETLQNLSVSGMLLQNEEGYPDLPANVRYIAIPQGSKALLKIISYDTETIKNIDITPAPVIPSAVDDAPLVYERNSSIYSKNAYFPESPVMLSEATQLRGVDVVSLGISPFQYNPVTKELIAYKNIKIEITFEGGNGHFGNDTYRSRWWEPILSDLILNYDQLPVIDYNEQIQNASKSMGPECEYAIIIPNAAEFAQWADSVKKFRTEQGILTKIFKFSDIGGSTYQDIQTFVSNAYTNWPIKPAAMLVLADYGTNANSTVSAQKYNHTADEDFPSDNYYADVTGDDLPDIVFSRIVANNLQQLQVMCSKFLNYERNPPTDPAFYNKPLTIMGWQTDRWFQLCAETVGGFLKSIGKNQVRINAGGPSSPSTWSTMSNTTTVVNYFGPSGLNYIPTSPATLGGFTGGTSSTINNAINSGSFFALHRDHGYWSGFGDPSYTSTNVNSLTNINNKLPFLFSVNCQTGGYGHATECLVEKMHRYTKNNQNSGILGAIGDAAISYSFVNDCMVWGMIDNLWPNFMPANTTTPASMERDKRPAFACASAKYFLKNSSWPSASASIKEITYHLYHMFGDAFQWFYSEVPQNLTVVHNSTIPSTATTFAVTANAGSFIALTVSSPTGPIILGTATGTGSPVTINLAQSPTTNMLVTVTKQDYFRYGSLVTLGPTSTNDIFANDFGLTCYPNPFNQSTTFSYSLDASSNVTLSVYNILGKEVAVIINNALQLSGDHQVEFSSKNLPSGIYSCVLKTDAQVITKNIVIEK